MPYPLPYIFMVMLYAALGYLHYSDEDEQHKNYCNAAAVVAFVLFFGFRGFLLTDWILYYPYYVNLEWGDILNFFIPDKQGMEPGFALFAMVCKTVSFGNYHFLEFVITCIVLTCIYRFMRRYTGNIALGLMIFLAFNGVGVICNLLRNSLAIGIFLLAIPYIEQRRPLQYYLLCLLALTFHISALVYLPLYFFFHRFPSRWIYLGVFVVANLAFITRFSIVEQLLEMMGLTGDAAMKADAYTGKMTTAVAVFSLGYIERLLTGMLIIAYHDKLKALHNGSGVIVNGVFMYLIMFFFFSQYDVLAQRYSFLFGFGYWIIWIDLMKCFYYANNRRLLAGLVVSYALLRSWTIYNAPDYMYENILTGAQSFNERIYFHRRNFHE